MSASLEQVFGPGTTQDATSITIPKANFVSFGLTPSATNNPQALFFCIVRFGSAYLTESRRADDRAIQPITITLAGRDALEDVSGTQEYVARSVYTIIQYKPVVLPDQSVSYMDV
ncbi:hypothetical protein ACN4EG_16645 [Alkalinema pantanalense CENA528]|uniref:hypothetical protein n=1 Tax=Alkalinema pantanalense TaxID=1620705 RepID=UPI003D6E57E5